jgi:hypothetical protein
MEFDLASWALPLFAAGGLRESVTPLVWIGVVVVAFANLRFGWTLSGLAVPGYLTFLFLCDPVVAAVAVAEGVMAYYFFLWLTRAVSGVFDCPEPFGRDRFFGLFLFSIVSRLLGDVYLIPFLGNYFELLKVTDTNNASQSFGTLVVALLANYFWKPGVLRGTIPIVTTTAVCYFATVYLLIPCTNYNLNAAKLLFTDSHFTIDAAAWTYLVLSLTALVASRMNVLFGWEYGGIILPSLVALELWNWVHIAGLVLDTATTVVLSGWVLRLPIFKKVTVEGARKMLLFFSVSLGAKIIFQSVLAHFQFGVLASELGGFGFLLSTLFAIKIHDKKMALRLSFASAQVAFAGYALAIGIAQLLLLTPFSSSAVEGSLKGAEVEDLIIRERTYTYSTSSASEIHRGLGEWLADNENSATVYRKKRAPTIEIALPNIVAADGFGREATKGRIIKNDTQEGSGRSASHRLTTYSCLRSGELWSLDESLSLAQKVNAERLTIFHTNQCKAGVPAAEFLNARGGRSLVLRFVDEDVTPNLAVPRVGRGALTVPDAESLFSELSLSWKQSLPENVSILTVSTSAQEVSQQHDHKPSSYLYTSLYELQRTVALGGYTSWPAKEFEPYQQEMLINELITPLVETLSYTSEVRFPAEIEAGIRRSESLAPKLGFRLVEVWDQQRDARAWILHGSLDSADLVGKGILVVRRPIGSTVRSISAGYVVFGRGIGELTISQGLREGFDVIALDTLPHARMPTRRTKLKTSLFAAIHEQLFRSVQKRAGTMDSLYLRLPIEDRIIRDNSDFFSVDTFSSKDPSLVEIMARRFSAITFRSVGVTDEVRLTHRNRFFKQGLTTRLEASFIGAEAVDLGGKESSDRQGQLELLPLGEWQGSLAGNGNCKNSKKYIDSALQYLLEGDVVPLERVVEGLGEAKIVRLPLTNDLAVVHGVQESSATKASTCMQLITPRRWLDLENPDSATMVAKGEASDQESLRSGIPVLLDELLLQKMVVGSNELGSYMPVKGRGDKTEVRSER